MQAAPSSAPRDRQVAVAFGPPACGEVVTEAVHCRCSASGPTPDQTEFRDGRSRPGMPRAGAVSLEEAVGAVPRMHRFQPGSIAPAAGHDAGLCRARPRTRAVVAGQPELAGSSCRTGTPHAPRDAASRAGRRSGPASGERCRQPSRHRRTGHRGRFSATQPGTARRRGGAERISADGSTAGHGGQGARRTWSPPRRSGRSGHCEPPRSAPRCAVRCAGSRCRWPRWCRTAAHGHERCPSDRYASFSRVSRGWISVFVEPNQTL
jgi:hypothetical protein